MWPFFVVVPQPSSELVSGIVQVQEPVPIEVFLPEPAKVASEMDRNSGVRSLAYSAAASSSFDVRKMWLRTPSMAAKTSIPPATR